MAILCNHQRAVPKGHSGQMEKLEARLLELQGLGFELEVSRRWPPCATTSARCPRGTAGRWRSWRRACWSCRV